jgi:DNA-binding SARP family transcriptional activator
MLFVHALGTAQIDIGGTCIRPNSARKFALLFYLSAERGRRISRAALQELRYPYKTDRKGRHALRELLYQLRQAGLVLDADAGSIELASGAVRSDYDELIEGDRPAAELVQAAAGGFLPGYVPTHSEAFSEWFEDYRGKYVLKICQAILEGRDQAARREMRAW